MKPVNCLSLKKKVRFGDCDSANVIHFHNLFRWAHESWEESIEKYGISFDEIFPCSSSKSKVLFPIVKSEAYFFKPIHLGDQLIINILPTKINNYSFKVETNFFRDSIKVAQSIIIHYTIDANTNLKVEICDNLEKWIESSNIKNYIEEC